MPPKRRTSPVRTRSSTKKAKKQPLTPEKVADTVSDSEARKSWKERMLQAAEAEEQQQEDAAALTSVASSSGASSNLSLPSARSSPDLEVQAYVADSMVNGVALSQQGGKRPERPGRLRAARSIKKEHPIGWRPTSTRWVGCIEAVTE